MERALSTRPATTVRNLTLAVLAAWFLFAVAGSLLGVFDSEPRTPVPLGLTVVVPVAVFGAWYLTSTRFRQFVSSLDMRLLTAAHLWRVAGVASLIRYQQGALPGVLAIPAGCGDIAIGITAPILAWYWKPPHPRRTLIVWNVLGTLDLVLVVTLGLVASSSLVGVLAGDVSTRLMGQFPFSLVPTFLVPLFLILHLISLTRLAKEEF